MATGKRYYWMKLKDSFMTSETVDFLMSQPNGANYVVLYQMLCLKTINTEGRFERQIGALLIPYDIEKIQRDTKWFSIDTIRIALNLYMQLGLIYSDENGVMVIANHNELVGSETDYAIQKSNQRKNNSPLKALPSVDNVHTNVPAGVHMDVHTENRDKRVENRDKSLDTREQILDSISMNDDDTQASGIIEEFAKNNGLNVESYELLQKSDARTRKRVTDTTRILFSKAVGTPPTEMDEAKVYCRVVDEHQKVSNERIYMLTCAFYKAAENGHRGQWNYIETILDDMDSKGVKTKDDVAVYFRSRKGEY